METPALLSPPRAGEEPPSGGGRADTGCVSLLPRCDPGPASAGLQDAFYQSPWQERRASWGEMTPTGVESQVTGEPPGPPPGGVTLSLDAVNTSVAPVNHRPQTQGRSSRCRCVFGNRHFQADPAPRFPQPVPSQVHRREPVAVTAPGPEPPPSPAILRPGCLQGGWALAACEASGALYPACAVRKTDACSPSLHASFQKSLLVCIEVSGRDVAISDSPRLPWVRGGPMGRLHLCPAQCPREM